MRKIKILGTTLVAMFAMGVVFASMASADDLTADAYPATLTGTQVTEHKLAFPEVGNTSCKHATFTATISGPTTTITVIPTYTECESLGFPAVVDMNGCHYLLHINGGGLTTGTVDVVCTPSTNKIDITVNPASPKCTIQVPAQTGKGTITGTNSGVGTTREVELALAVTGITAHSTEGAGIGKCPTKNTAVATLNGSAKVTGEKDETGTPAHTGIFLS